ncbi:MAG TPA: ribonuclease H-like domain-containing protein [Puia sp.]|nr:ribonuclease H-like domain-containing protein [Puia sp.]
MLNNILFLDIETTPQYSSFNELPDEWKQLWSHKASFLIKNPETDSPETIYNRAGIYAEFGKIICISCGIISGYGENKKILLKSFYGDDEKETLLSFCEMLNRWAIEGNKFLCAHNGKEFDFPYLCRRLIINGMNIPPILKISGKKPWEVPHLDTMELWKFGDYKSFTSLNLLARTLHIATPKDDIDGSMVAEVYWKEHDLQRIANYCQKDVVTVAQVYLRLNGETLISSENIQIK